MSHNRKDLRIHDITSNDEDAQIQKRREEYAKKRRFRQIKSRIFTILVLVLLSLIVYLYLSYYNRLDNTMNELEMQRQELQREL